MTNWRHDALASGYTQAVLCEAIRCELRRSSTMKGSLMKISRNVRLVLAERLQNQLNIAQVYIMCATAIKLSLDMKGIGSDATPEGVAFGKWSRDYVKHVIASSDAHTKNCLFKEIVQIIDDAMAAREESTLKLGNAFVLKIRLRTHTKTTRTADFYLQNLINASVFRSRKALKNYILLGTLPKE